MSAVSGSPSWEIDQLLGGMSSLLNPLNDVISYIFPKGAPLVSGAVKLRKKPDPSMEANLPFERREKVLAELSKLFQAVELPRKVASYVASKEDFVSFGGKFSFSSPVLILPRHHIFREKEGGDFGQEKNHETLAKDCWRLTDDETRFLILRKIIHIKLNDSVLRLAARVAMAAALAMLRFAPLTWYIAIPLFVVAVLFHFSVERVVNNQIDRLAVNCLAKISKNAIPAAINTLKKQQEKNLFWRKSGRLGRILITEKGERRFCFTSPSLADRISQLEALQRAPRGAAGQK